MAVIPYRRQRRVFFKRTRVPQNVFGGLLIAGALAWLALGYTVAPPSMPSALAAESSASVLVTSVYDGDTFRLGAERVRIVGLDAPEIGGGAKCAREQDAAVKARDFLAEQIALGEIHLNRAGKDSYGRTLATVFVDGKDISEVMIGKGLARPYVQGEHGRWCELTRS